MFIDGTWLSLRLGQKSTEVSHDLMCLRRTTLWCWQSVGQGEKDQLAGDVSDPGKGYRLGSRMEKQTNEIDDFGSMLRVELLGGLKGKRARVC